MKRLEKCCCCATTRTGTLIMAWLGVVFGAIGVIGAWTLPAERTSSGHNGDSSLPRVLSTINALVAVIISVLLILGVKKRRSTLMLPWLVVAALQAVANVINQIVAAVGRSNQGRSADAGPGPAGYIIGSIIGLCLFLYLWGVVLSHYLDVRDEEKRGRYNEGAGAQARNAA